MSDSTPRLGLPDMPETPELYPDLVADAFARIDAFTDLYLKGQFVNTPPASPADGDAYLIGGSPTGAWSGQAYKIATCRDGAWTLLTPFNGLRAYVATSGAFIVHADGVWTDWNSMIGAGESSIASAAACNIGAADALFLQVTGATAITSFGTAANKLRFLRFAGALTLTHNATSLILPGAANIATMAGDTALFTSDASGNWRCRFYARADGRMVNMASPAFTGTAAAPNYQISGGGLLGAGEGSLTVTQGTPVSGKIATFTNGIDTNIIFPLSSGASGIGSGTNTPFLFHQNGGSPGRIGSDGSFLWGTATNGGYNGNAIAEFKTAVQGASFWNTAGGSNNCAALFRVDYSASPLARFNYGTSMVGQVTTNGSSVTYSTTSDARLKTVLARQADYRDTIRALWVGDFTWNDGGAPGFGVLAQQAWATMPHHQGVTRPATEEGIWQASAEPFAHLALWGVKDLYGLIEALSARVAALEAAHAG